MNDTAPQPPAGGENPFLKSVHMMATLGGVALAAGVLMVTVYESTAPRVQANRAERLEEAIYQVLPGAENHVAFVPANGGVERAPEEDQQDAAYFAGYDEEGELIGVAVRGSAQGYQDVIRALFGYDPFEERIMRFNVLENKETPGLGDRIATDPNFLESIEGLDVSLESEGETLRNPVTHVEEGSSREDWEIDGISGATISVKAVTKLINDSMEEHGRRLQNSMDTLEEAAP
ncbi:MAG: FMN-binding protein [Candidatus Hydrogenedentota bacterium]